MSENQSHQKELNLESSGIINKLNGEISVPKTTPAEQSMPQHDFQIGFVLILALLAIFYVACSWIRKQTDRLIEVKGIRLVFTVIILPLMVVFISEQFAEENKKFVYLLALIVSIITSERSTTLTVDKRCKDKDATIGEVRNEVEDLKKVILGKISEFKDVHLARLLRISNDQNLLTADDVRREVFAYTNFMLFQSTFLHTVDELKYKTNSEISSGDNKTLDSYNGLMN
ncbi:hypothetical protein V6917_20680 [Pectobacterium brasiliense]|uniref:hypothetical protein n=1 Tax=Pectobacterium brasiliense TaxID=180957 RepID=UPI0004E6383D|nr:hypothetical protein [Pectobacterium brasiliense]KFF71652.1 hypothetical protein IW00_00015 [Pectobacterium brasiliense]